MKLFLRALKIPKVFDKKSDLISNVAINKLLSPVYFFLIFYYLHYIKKIPLIGEGVLKGSLQLATISTLYYAWCSYFFQPDLDVRKMRPGMNTFPVGSTILNSSLGLLILPIQRVLCKMWYYTWHPFSLIFTHRGISHWPIISTYLRVFYLKVIFSTVYYLLYPLLGEVYVILSVIKYFDLFWISNPYFLTPIWFLFCFPVFIVDIFHELVDLIDSKRKGLSYCPPQIPRGLLANALAILKQLIKRT